MSLIIVRHGRTEANASGLLLGHLDPALDEIGRAQAAAVGRVLGGGRGPASPLPIARIISSPLGRTRETAAAIAEATGAEVEVDGRWIELDYGEFDGRPQTDVPAEVWSAWRQDPTFAPPGGESLVDLGVRVRDALGTIAAQAQDHHIVIVSHVSPIKAAVTWALGVGDDVVWRMFLSPASITRVSVAARGAVLQGFNDTSHLADIVIPGPADP